MKQWASGDMLCTIESLTNPFRTGAFTGLAASESHDGSVRPLLLVMSDWLDLPLIWVYLTVYVAALRGVTSGVTQAIL